MKIKVVDIDTKEELLDVVIDTESYLEQAK